MMVYVILPQGLHIQINDGTTPLKGNEIPFSVVPTLINGIATSTSIIIAFGGTVVGFLLSRLPKKDKRRSWLFAFLFLFAFSFIYLFTAYYLSISGEGFFGFALRHALVALLLSLLILILVLIFASTIIDAENETNQTESESQKSTPNL
jgi:uncharacterized membrane protein YhdT